MTTKSLHIRIPEAMYEAFFRAYPAHGERSRLVEQFILRAIDQAEHKDRLIDKITKEVMEDASRDNNNDEA